MIARDRVYDTESEEKIVGENNETGNVLSMPFCSAYTCALVSHVLIRRMISMPRCVSYGCNYLPCLKRKRNKLGFYPLDLSL